jgi:hypothetical protein
MSITRRPRTVAALGIHEDMVYSWRMGRATTTGSISSSAGTAAAGRAGFSLARAVLSLRLLLP